MGRHRAAASSISPSGGATRTPASAGARRCGRRSRSRSPSASACCSATRCASRRSRVSPRRGGARRRCRRVPARRGAVVVGGGALAFAGAAALLVADRGAEAPRGRRSSAAHRRGLAGRIGPADRHRRIRSGHRTTRICERRCRICARPVGAAVPRCEPQDTTDPARAWTTIATGVPPEVHGVHGIETRARRRRPGACVAGDRPLGRAIGAATDLVRLTRPSIASRDERRSKTMWEVAEDAGLRTAVVNWWATWPAPPGRRHRHHRSRGAAARARRRARRGDRAGRRRIELLADRWPAIRHARARRGARRHSRTAADPRRRSDPAPLGRARRDASLGIAAARCPRPARDLTSSICPGSTSRSTRCSVRPRRRAGDLCDGRARGRAAFRTIRFSTRVAGATRSTGATTSTIMIVTQPGRVQTSARRTPVAVGYTMRNGRGRQSGPRFAARSWRRRCW